MTTGIGGNELNPSGYAMPGAVGGPMSLTTDDGSLVLGFDGVSTAQQVMYTSTLTVTTWQELQLATRCSHTTI